MDGYKGYKYQSQPMYEEDVILFNRSPRKKNRRRILDYKKIRRSWPE